MEDIIRLSWLDENRDMETELVSLKDIAAETKEALENTANEKNVTNIIPFFGQYIGIIPSAVLVFIASPSKGILFLVLIIILMQFDGNVLGPKILGDSIGLKSFWILFSILFFGSLFGVLGMICAVPVFAVIYRMVKRFCAGRLAKKQLPTETECYCKAWDDAWEPGDENKKG